MTFFIKGMDWTGLLQILNIMTFQMIFDIFEQTNSYKIKIIQKFWLKQCPFTQNFAKQPNIICVPKVLGIIFYPWNHPSQGQKLKNGLKEHFLGHPVHFHKKLVVFLHQVSSNT